MTDKTTTNFYTMPAALSSTMCDVCADCCDAGTTGGAPYHYAHSLLVVAVTSVVAYLTHIILGGRV